MFLQLSQLPIPQRQAWLQHAIAPRPIAFVSTIDKEGNVNLSPFSFFNLFSVNPPIIIFSPSRSGRDNTLKHTLQNVLEVPEVAINICNYNMVQQISLSSCEYAKGIDEFIKAGFTKKQATQIKPPLVQESSVQLECKVIEVKSLGDNAGAGQLVIAEVLCMHINDDVLNDDKTMIEQSKLNLIARLGGDNYAVINKENLFVVPKPNKNLGIGVDALPQGIRTSKILTGNSLGLLANVQELPKINAAFTDDTLKNIVQYFSINPAEMEHEIHMYAQKLLQQNLVDEAWQVLLTAESL